MPPPAVKTIKDLIFYQYAKIIAYSAGFSNSKSKKPNYAFIMDRFLKLKSGELRVSSSLKELKSQILNTDNRCEFCGAEGNLSWDHLIPTSRGGPDTMENQVLACRSCNSSKGKKGLYEWLGSDQKDDLSRIVNGKYLKLLCEIHETNGTLDATDLNGDGKMDVFDLEVY